MDPLEDHGTTMIARLLFQVRLQDGQRVDFACACGSGLTNELRGR